MIHGGTRKAHTECEVTPLVRAANKSANKTGDDHDPINEDDPEESRPWHARRKEQIHKQQRGSDEPVDVPNIEDLTVNTADLGVAAAELNVDRGPAKVGSHGEVGNGGGHGNSGSDVMENTMLTRLGNSKTGEDEGRQGHDSSHCPVPVGAADGDGDVSALAVDSVAIDAQGVVSTYEIVQVVHCCWR